MRPAPLHALAGIIALATLPLACATPNARSADDVAPSTSATSPAPPAMAPVAGRAEPPVRPAILAPRAAPPVDSSVTASPAPPATATAASPSSPLRLSDAVFDATLRARGYVIIGKLTKLETLAKGTKSEGEQCTFSVVKRIPLRSGTDAVESTTCGAGFRAKIGKTFVLALDPGRTPWSGLPENQYIEVPPGQEDEAFRVNADRRGAATP